jgi:uncharacterized repeat protein (TIGR03803 family)
MRHTRSLIAALTCAVTVVTTGVDTHADPAISPPIRTLTPVKILHVFTDEPDTAGQLLAASDGSLYGTLPRGGPTHAGLVYRVAPDGHGQALHVFSGPDGTYPGIFLEGLDGAIYGLVQVGQDTHQRCGLYRVRPSGEFSFLYRFPDSSSAHFVAHLRAHSGESYLLDGGVFCAFEKTTETAPPTSPANTTRADQTLSVEEISQGERGIQQPIAPWAGAPIPQKRVSEAVPHVLSLTSDACYPEVPVKSRDGTFYGLVECRGLRPRSRCFVYRVDSATDISLTYEFIEPQEHCRFPGPLVVAPDGRLYGVIFDYTYAHLAVFRVDTATISSAK